MFERQWSDKEIDHPHALDAYPRAFKNELKRAYVEIERLQGLVSERDAQLEVCVEALRELASQITLECGCHLEAKEALEKVGVVE